MITISLDTVLVFFVCLLCLLTGFLFGRLNMSNGGVLTSDVLQNNHKAIKNNIANQKSLIKIDDTKFVTEIDTGSMEKKFDSLGETVVSEDSLDQSINKLKNLKR
jgi:hypothetical protein